MERTEIPPVAAVFLVIFDQKVGYTTAWKRNLPNVDLDGVEYQCLPSGLHAVKEDLVYFIHGAHAGVSIFVQEEADAEHRNAHFAAVGALVPLSYGQLGRSWTHAQELRRLAREVVNKPSDIRPLELFWNKHRAADASPSTSSPVSPTVKRPDGTFGAVSRKRKRALSEATLAGFDVDQALPADHPALHISAMLDTFGPLLFPLHRAALSRRRVLLLGSPSVQANANVVYLVSVLSRIPDSLAEMLPSDARPLLRTSPLFSVGIHDIPTLTSKKDDITGWIACTTDDILGEKRELYDILIRLPASQHFSPKIWPKITLSDGRIIKASQRDYRRWTLLKRELRRLRRQTVGTSADFSSLDPGGDSDQRPLLQRRRTSFSLYEKTGIQDQDESEAVEPPSWSAVAYRGFMWWASAGEANAWENDEARADEELLFDLPDIGSITSPEEDTRTPSDLELEYVRIAATFVVAYFRRVTESLLRPLVTIIEEADDDTEEGIQEDDISVTSDDIRDMGLDTWSIVDKAFLRDMMKTWFGRSAVVVDQGYRICGVRVC